MLENLCILSVRSFQRLKPESHNYVDVNNFENLVKVSMIF